MKSSAGNNIIVLDIGTTGVKSIIFDAEKNVVSRSYHKMSKKVEGAIVEQNPKEIVNACIKVLKRSFKDSKLSPKDIRALSLTTQRETTMLWDKETGKTVYPAIVWEDQRTSAFCKPLAKKHNAFVRQRTGLQIDPYFSASKIHWVLSNAPKALKLLGENRLLFGTVDTWAIWNLLEGRPHLTDYTNASRTLLFDIRKLKWGRDLMDIFNIPPEILPSPLPPRSEYGYLRKDILGFKIPLVAVCGDQQASMFAAGTKKGDTKVTFGTGTFMMQTTGKLLIQDPFFSTITPTLKGITYAIEAKVPLGGIQFEPLIGNRPKMKSFLVELMRKLSPYIAALPIKPKKIVIDGGMTQAIDLPEVFKSATGAEPIKPKTYDGTALGAAMLAD